MSRNQKTTSLQCRGSFQLNRRANEAKRIWNYTSMFQLYGLSPFQKTNAIVAQNKAQIIKATHDIVMCSEHG